MSMANAIRIKYKGEVLCCLDPTEVRAVDHYLYFKNPPQNVFRRICGWISLFIMGKMKDGQRGEREDYTKVLFKDGSSLLVRMPFLEFINAYY